MRIRISQQISLTYAQPVRLLAMSLRMMPRDHESQHVASWRIDPSADGRLRSVQDPFGNLVHEFVSEAPVEALRVLVEGQVDTTDQAGIVRGTVEPLPLRVFLRATGHTAPSERAREVAQAARKGARDDLDTMHRLMEALHGEASPRQPAPQATSQVMTPQVMSQIPPPDRLGGATDAPAAVQASTHLFVSAARLLGFPARYVSGWLAEDGSGAAHAWAEAHVDGYGWIGFDAVAGRCPTDTHVRAAVGLDRDDVSALRIAGSTRSGETIDSRLAVWCFDQ